MTQTAKTWSVILLALIIALLVLWLRKKQTTATTTNTSVKVGSDTTNFPTRNETNNQLLRVCTYDNGETLSLDPGAVGGHCPPVYTDIAGRSGNLIKDEIITLPQAGTYSATPGGA